MTQQRVLEQLVALTRKALDAVATGDVDAVHALDAQRRESIAALRGDGSPERRCAELAGEARALDAQLSASVSRRRDELGALARDLPALERATRGYAMTDALDTDMRRT